MERARWFWVRVAWVYGLLLAFGIFFVGPFLMGFLASLKTDPLEWPFRFVFPQLKTCTYTSGFRFMQGRPLERGCRFPVG